MESLYSCMAVEDGKMQRCRSLEVKGDQKRSGFSNDKTVGDVLKPPRSPPSRGFFRVVWCALMHSSVERAQDSNLGPQGVGMASERGL